MAACVGDLRASLVGGHRGARDVGEGGYLNTQHNIGRFLKKYNVFAQIVLLAFYNFYVRVRYTISCLKKQLLISVNG
uniref:Uncharacterized protein n=1 Tax=Aegilops tauschii subsp. strangulata TaxID=200361 RepID=A0A453I2A6_AEGTS